MAIGAGRVGKKKEESRSRRILLKVKSWKGRDGGGWEEEGGRGGGEGVASPHSLSLSFSRAGLTLPMKGMRNEGTPTAPWRRIRLCFGLRRISGI